MLKERRIGEKVRTYRLASFEMESFDICIQLTPETSDQHQSMCQPYDFSLRMQLHGNAIDWLIWHESNDGKYISGREDGEYRALG